MASFACCVERCGGTICLTSELEKRLRRTHEFFVCPFGHQQHFATQTAEEKLIAELRRELRMARRVRDNWRERYEEVANEFHKCPAPDCSWSSHAHPSRVWRSMLRHWVKCHSIDQLVRPEALPAGVGA